MVYTDRRKWLALALLCVVQFMVVLDIAIVNVALPSIKIDLGFSQGDLQWVISAYALVFGGFLLLGGRAADMLGRRRVFLAGIVVFTAASLLAGLAWSDALAHRGAGPPGAGRGDHHARRAVDPVDDVPRGAGAQHRARRLGCRRRLRRRGRRTARGSPDRRPELGVDLLRQRPGRRRRASSWRRCSWSESRDARVKRFDVPGRGARDRRALRRWSWRSPRRASTAGSSAEAVAIFALSAVLLAGFVAWELRHADPLMRFGILRTRTVSGANVAGFIMGTAMFSMFLMLTLYMQQVLGYSPMKTGVAYLAVAGTAIVWSAVAAQLVTRVGVKPVLVVGMAMLTAGLVFFTQVSVDGHLRARPAAGLPGDRRRDRVLVRADLDRRAGRRPSGRGRARVRADQHLAADRWRARDRRAVDDRDLRGPRTRSRRERSCPRRWSTASPRRSSSARVIAAVGLLASLTLIRRDELEAPVPLAVGRSRCSTLRDVVVAATRAGCPDVRAPRTLSALVQITQTTSESRSVGR